MKIFVKGLLLSVAASGALAGAVIAADLPIAPVPMPAPKAEQQRIMPAPGKLIEFEDLGADCIEASDTCRRFTRAGDGKYHAANNIGIACQPTPLVCTKRR